jgi:flagellar motor switch protein FliG
MSNDLMPMDGRDARQILSTPVEPAGRPAARPRAAPTHAPHPVRTAHPLTPRDKAAIILRLLVGDGTEAPVDGLDAPALANALKAMARLSYVDADTTRRVVQDFLAELDAFALYFHGGIDGAIAALKPLVTDEVRALLADLPPEPPDDPWDRLAARPADILAHLLAAETPQVVALALSRLGPGRAAELLEALAPDIAREATLAAARLDKVTPATLARIGETLEQAAVRATAAGPLQGTPVDRVGAILNFAPGGTRDALLGSLDAADGDLADRIRRVMFTFADIPDRIEVKDIPKLVRAVPNETMVAALAGAVLTQKDVADFVLSNLSKRLAEQLNEEIAEIGTIKPKDADAAMNAIVQAIRDLESAGEIILISPEE